MILRLNAMSILLSRDVSPSANFRFRLPDRFYFELPVAPLSKSKVSPYAWIKTIGDLFQVRRIPFPEELRKIINHICF